MMHEGILCMSTPPPQTRMAHSRERFMTVSYRVAGENHRILTTTMAEVSFRKGVLCVSGAGVADLVVRDVSSFGVELDPRSDAFG